MIDKKIIIVNGFTEDELKEFILWYKKNEKLPKPIFAVITEHSIEWKVKDLLNELIKEDEEIKKQRQNK